MFYKIRDRRTRLEQCLCSQMYNVLVQVVQGGEEGGENKKLFHWFVWVWSLRRAVICSL